MNFKQVREMPASKDIVEGHENEGVESVFKEIKNVF
jgi:hypothetical protein